MSLLGRAVLVSRASRLSAPLLCRTCTSCSSSPRSMSTLRTIRDFLADRREPLAYQHPIATTEDFIKYQQAWPINTDNDTKPQNPSDREIRSKQRDSVRQINEKHLVSTEKYTSVAFEKRREVNGDTRVYTFKHDLAGGISALHLDIGQHILCGFMMHDGIVERPYAICRPTGADKDDGTIDVLVKTIFPDDKSPGGLVSNIMDCLKSGDRMLIRGPEGPVKYKGNGKFEILAGENQDKLKKVEATNVNFISGGSGMTPIWATLKAMVETDRKDDGVQVRFMDANVNEKEIILEKELNELERRSKILKITHVLEKPNRCWKGETGLIDEEKMRKHLFPAKKGCVTFVCGPPPMLKAAAKGLKEMGFEEDETFFHY